MTVPKISILILTIGATLFVSEPGWCAEEMPRQQGEKLTLNAAITEALAQSPALRAIEADIESARGEVLTAQTRPNPELTFTPALKHVSDVGASHNEFKGAVGLSQLFLFPGKRELLLAIAERNVELRQLATEGWRFQLTTAVRKAFYELLAAQAIVSLRQQQLDSALSFQQAAAKRAESGYASNLESVKSQSDVINAMRLLVSAGGEVAVACVELNSLLGRDLQAPLEVNGTLDDAVAERSLPDLLAVALAGNPSLRVLAMQAEIAGLNLRKARLARKPDFAVGPAIEYSKSEQILGLSATVELPGKNYGRGEILAATADQRKVLAETEQLRREIAGAVTKAATQLATARNQLALCTPGHREQLKAFAEQAERSYAQNATSLLIFLDAKRAYFDALADYNDAITNVVNSRAALEAAVGVPLEIQSPKPNP